MFDLQFFGIVLFHQVFPKRTRVSLLRGACSCSGPMALYSRLVKWGLLPKFYIGTPANIEGKSPRKQVNQVYNYHRHENSFRHGRHTSEKNITVWCLRNREELFSCLQLITEYNYQNPTRVV